MNDPQTVGELLDRLTGHGVYDVALVDEQLPKFGFRYNRATDRLQFKGGVEKLGVLSRDEMIEDMARSSTGNILDTDIPDKGRLIDALALSRAVHKLLLPGQAVPGDNYNGRARQFRKNVESILAFESRQKLEG
ncbi:MAG TPA: hypothetical protein VFX15_03170 [Actinomycetes bacterium]|nr:hypothetical protein [Actinomycetes bacterium]